MDKWNPMEDDYNDKSFNSYDRGPGRNLPADPRERQQCHNLYVRGVPQALNEDGVRNLFGKYGNIKSCRILRSPNYATNLAFVMMETVEQCSDVIQNLNGHKIGNDRLFVEFAKSAEAKERDRQEKERQEELIKSMGSGRTVTNVGELNDGTNLQVSIPNTNNEMNQGAVNRAANYGADPRAGGDMIGNTPKGYARENPNVRPRETYGQANGYAGLKECEQCGKAGSSYKCGKCLVHYCSSACQAKNWPSHKHICGTPSTNTHQISSTPETKPSTSRSTPPGAASQAPPSERNGRVHSLPAAVPAASKSQPTTAPAAVQNLPTTAPAPTSISLPSKESVKVKLVEFQSPARFFVQLVNRVDLLRLQCTLNQQCIPCTHPRSQPGDLLAVQLATGVWHRGLVIAYRNHQYFVYLVDIGQKHFANTVSPIPYEVASIPFQAIECSLYGVVPYKGGSWTDFAVQACTKFGLNTGDLYSITCVSTNVGNQVMFTLPDGSDLGDQLVTATAALVDPLLRYTVWDSLHRHLNIGDTVSLGVEASSVEGVDGFYAQIGNEELRSFILAFGELESQMTAYGVQYGESNVWNDRDNKLPVMGDHVLCLYEGCWSRAEVVVTGQDNTQIGVAFLDYGNLQLMNSTQMIHLPRHFSHMPAIAAKIHIDGITDSSVSSIQQKAIQFITELAAREQTLKATVRDRSLDTLSVLVTKSDGTDLASSLLEANLAAPMTDPLQDSLLLAIPQKPTQPTQQPPSQQPPSQQPPSQQPPSQQPPSQQASLSAPSMLQPSKVVVVDAPSNAAAASSSASSLQSTSSNSSSVTQQQIGTVTVKPLLSKGTSYTVRLRKLDGTQRFCVNFPQELTRSLEPLSKRLNAFYMSNTVAKVSKPAEGDFVVFLYTDDQSPAVCKRGCVQKVASAKRVALVQHVDFEDQTSKVVFNDMRVLLPQFAEPSSQALPVCQLEGITDVDQKNALLKPYMTSVIKIQVVDYSNGVYTVRATCDGQPLQRATARRHWMAGTDIPYAQLPPGSCEARVLYVDSPQRIYLTPRSPEDLINCLSTIKEESAKANQMAPPKTVKPGEVLFILSTEYEEWDRVIVLQTLPGDQLSVRSAEFGTVYTEALSNARPLDVATAALPLRAIPCSLAGVSGTPTNDACEYVKKLTDCMVQVEVVDQSNGLQVRIIDSSGQDVAEALNSTCATAAVEVPPAVQAPPAVRAPPAVQPSQAPSAENQRLARLEAMLQTLQEEISTLRVERARLQEDK